MPKYSKGKGSGLTEEQKTIMDKMWYNEGTESIHTSVPFITTLNSFYLGNQHKISSGGENVIFTNLTTDIDWFPAWQGLKNQSIVTNQDKTGIIPASTRTYSDNLTTLPFSPEASPLSYMPYATTIPVVANISYFGIQIRPKNIIPTGHSLYFNVHINSKNETKVYGQKIKITSDLPAGELFTWWFDHPMEGTKDTVIYLDIENKDLNDNRTLLNGSVNENGTPFANQMYRFFEDKALATEEWTLNHLLDIDITEVDYRVETHADLPTTPANINGTSVISAYINTSTGVLFAKKKKGYYVYENEKWSFKNLGYNIPKVTSQELTDRTSNGEVRRMSVDDVTALSSGSDWIELRTTADLEPYVEDVNASYWVINDSIKLKVMGYLRFYKSISFKGDKVEIMSETNQTFCMWTSAWVSFSSCQEVHFTGVKFYLRAQSMSMPYTIVKARNCEFYSIRSSSLNLSSNGVMANMSFEDCVFKNTNEPSTTRLDYSNGVHISNINGVIRFARCEFKVKAKCIYGKLYSTGKLIIEDCYAEGTEEVFVKLTSAHNLTVISNLIMNRDIGDGTVICDTFSNFGKLSLSAIGNDGEFITHSHANPNAVDRLVSKDGTKTLRIDDKEIIRVTGKEFVGIQKYNQVEFDAIVPEVEELAMLRKKSTTRYENYYSYFGQKNAITIGAEYIRVPTDKSTTLVSGTGLGVHYNHTLGYWVLNGTSSVVEFTNITNTEGTFEWRDNYGQWMLTIGDQHQAITPANSAMMVSAVGSVDLAYRNTEEILGLYILDLSWNVIYDDEDTTTVSNKAVVKFWDNEKWQELVFSSQVARTFFAEIKYFALRDADFDGWKLCNGRNLTTRENALLDLSGMRTSWETMFIIDRLPNLNGRVLASQEDGKLPFEGATDKTILEGQMPRHTHGISTETSQHWHHFDPSQFEFIVGEDPATNGANQVPMASGTWGYSSLQSGVGGTQKYPKVDGAQTVAGSSLPHKHTVTLDPTYEPESLPAENDRHSHTVGMTGGTTSFNVVQPTARIGNYFIYIGE